MKSFNRLFFISVILFLTCLFFVPFAEGVSQSFTWNTVTSHRSINHMLFFENSIWASTEGGIYQFSVSENRFYTFTKTDGLSSVNTTSLAMDGNGKLWIGMTDGTLNSISMEDMEVRSVSIDPEPLNIYDLIHYDNNLYIAHEFGISLFLINNEEVNSTFRILGGFPVNTAVNSLFIHNNSLWAATDFGIAGVLLTAANPQDPQFWTNYTTSNGLSDNRINCFSAIGDVLFAGTANGVCRLTENGFVADGLANENIRTLKYLSGSLYAAGSYQVYRRRENGSWEVIQPELRYVNDLVSDGDGRIWAGHYKDGIYMYDPQQSEWINYFQNGPAGNEFEEIIIDSENRMWCATGLTAGKGIYIKKEADWINLNTNHGLSRNHTTGIAEGPDGRIWVGTPGHGLMVMDGNPEDPEITIINETEGLLAGADTPSFVVVQKIRRDVNGNIWILNKFASNGRALIAVTPDNEWHYYSESDGLESTEVTCIEFDEFDRVWIGTARFGLNMLDYGGTLDDRTDDIWTLYTTTDGLYSNRITDISAQTGNGVWIATEEGINHIIAGLAVQRIQGALSNFVTTVEIDPSGNKWFGTLNGVSLLNPDEVTWEHYTAENSYLVSNEIVNIYFHENTGNAYISTPRGLSIITTPFKGSPPDASKISVYPNPFILDGSGNKLVIENLLLDSTVRIFTISGRMVKSLTPSGGDVMGTMAFWDGRDKNGSPVSSGVYIVVAGTDNSNSGLTKVAVIRK